MMLRMLPLGCLIFSCQLFKQLAWSGWGVAGDAEDVAVAAGVAHVLLLAEQKMSLKAEGFAGDAEDAAALLRCSFLLPAIQ